MKPRYPKTAEGWTAYLLDHRPTEADLEALDAWRRQDPRNEEELALLDRAWRVAAQLENDPELADSLREDSGRGRQRRTAIRYAASIAAVLSIGVLAATILRPAVEPATRYQTATGEQESIALADGSQIELNTATLVEVEAGEREVRLHQGEAFFAVEPGDETFRVHAGDAAVRVLGTQFNVHRSADGLAVSVSEGVVEVEVTAPTSPPVAPYRLEVGQSLLLPGDGGPAQILDDSSDLARIQAWRSGTIVFARTPLSDAIRELNRYSPASIVIEEPELEALPVSGVFHIARLGKLESLIFALENSLPVRAQLGADRLELSHSG